MTTTDEQPPQGQRTNSLILAASIGGGILLVGWALLRVFGAAAEGESVVSAFSPIFNFILEVARAIGGIVLFAMLVAWMVTRTEKKVPVLEEQVRTLQAQLRETHAVMEARVKDAATSQFALATLLKERADEEAKRAADTKRLTQREQEVAAREERIERMAAALEKRAAAETKADAVPDRKWGDVAAAIAAIVAALRENPNLPIRKAKRLWVASGGKVPKDDYKQWAATFTAIKSLSSPAQMPRPRVILQRGKGGSAGEQGGEQAGERPEAEA